MSDGQNNSEEFRELKYTVQLFIRASKQPKPTACPEAQRSLVDLYLKVKSFHLEEEKEMREVIRRTTPVGPVDPDLIALQKEFYRDERATSIYG